MKGWILTSVDMWLNLRNVLYVGIERDGPPFIIYACMPDYSKINLEFFDTEEEADSGLFTLMTELEE